MSTKNISNLINSIVNRTDSVNTVQKLLEGIFDCNEINLIHQAVSVNDSSQLEAHLNKFMQGRLSPLEHYFSLCQRAISINPFSIKYLSEELLRDNLKELYIAAVKLNGFTLRLIPKEHQNNTICSIAVDQNIYALKLVDEALRFSLCNKHKEQYLEQSFMSHVYFHSDEKKSIVDFLKTIQYILVFDHNDLKDREIEDAKRIYLLKKRQKGKKVTTIASKDLHNLMDYKDFIPSGVKLVIFGHNLPSTGKIAGMDEHDISTILEQYPFFGQVTLFGCKSVHSEKLDEELKTIQRVAREKSVIPPSGLLMIDENDLLQTDKLFRAAGLDSIFAIVYSKKDGEITYYVRSIAKINGSIHTEQSAPLSEKNIEEIATLLSKKNLLTWPRRKNTHLYFLRTKGHPLSFKELNFFNAFFSKDPFDQKSPAYQKAKLDYPFLQGLTITFDESQKKLKPSMMSD